MKVYVLRSPVTVVVVSSVMVCEKYYLVPGYNSNQYDVYERGVWTLEIVEAEDAK